MSQLTAADFILSAAAAKSASDLILSDASVGDVVNAEDTPNGVTEFGLSRSIHTGIAVVEIYSSFDNFNEEIGRFNTIENN
jgi:hypothetical protein